MCASVFTAGTFVLHMGNISSWCSLVDANWKPPLGKPLCSTVQSIDSVAIFTVADVTTDVVILSIPVHALWTRAS